MHTTCTTVQHGSSRLKDAKVWSHTHGCSQVRQWTRLRWRRPLMSFVDDRRTDTQVYRRIRPRHRMPSLSTSTRLRRLNAVVDTAVYKLTTHTHTHTHGLWSRIALRPRPAVSTLASVTSRVELDTLSSKSDISIVRYKNFYFAPRWSACLHVCLSVCLSLRLRTSNAARPNFTKSYAHVIRGRGSVRLWRRWDTLRTSGFVDDVMFSCKAGNNPDSQTTRVSSSSPGGGTLRTKDGVGQGVGTESEVCRVRLHLVAARSVFS